MDNSEFLVMLQQMEETNTPPPPPKFDEYRVYYDDNGVPTHYSHSELPGKWIHVTQDQFMAARFDARVVDGVLVYTHNRRLVYKYERNSAGDVRTSKYDITVLVDDSEPEHALWKLTTYDD